MIFDVDGTLLDISHRIHLIRPPNFGKKDWEAFRAAAWGDTLIKPIVAVLEALHTDAHHIIVATGRMEKERPLLDNTLGGILDEVPIYMRANGDLRADSIVKLEMLMLMRQHGYDPKLVFDDRQQVVNMWRAAGLTCCQVAEGNF